MFTFAAFEGFGKLNEEVAYEAYVNAERRLRDHLMLPRYSAKPGQYPSFETELKLKEDTKLYHQAWRNCRFAEIKENHTHQCGYCGSTRGFDGWNCISCGAC